MEYPDNTAASGQPASSRARTVLRQLEQNPDHMLRRTPSGRIEHRDGTGRVVGTCGADVLEHLLDEASVFELGQTAGGTEYASVASSPDAEPIASVLKRRAAEDSEPVAGEDSADVPSAVEALTIKLFADRVGCSTAAAGGALQKGRVDSGPSLDPDETCRVSRRTVAMTARTLDYAAEQWGYDVRAALDVEEHLDEERLVEDAEAHPNSEPANEDLDTEEPDNASGVPSGDGHVTGHQEPSLVTAGDDLALVMDRAVGLDSLADLWDYDLDLDADDVAVAEAPSHVATAVDVELLERAPDGTARFVGPLSLDDAGEALRLLRQETVESVVHDVRGDTAAAEAHGANAAALMKRLDAVAAELCDTLETCRRHLIA